MDEEVESLDMNLSPDPLSQADRMAARIRCHIGAAFENT